MTVELERRARLEPRSAPPAGRAFAALVRRGLADQRRAPLTWGGSLGAMGALIAAIWPSIEDSVDQLTESYPENLKQAFNIDTLDTVERYVDAEMLSFIIPLAVAFYAIRCITRATVAAEDRGHLDTLLALPVRRRLVVAAAFTVGAIMTAVVLFVTWLATWLAGTVAGTGISAVTLAEGMVNVWPLALAFAGIAALAAGLLRGSGTVTGVAAGTLVAMYLLDVVGRLADPIEPLRALSAFRYYGSAIQDGLDASHIAALIVGGLLCAVAGALAFERRDVR
jgi:ABC-2 type transport system permease protein